MKLIPKYQYAGKFRLPPISDAQFRAMIAGQPMLSDTTSRVSSGQTSQLARVNHEKSKPLDRGEINAQVHKRRSKMTAEERSKEDTQNAINQVTASTRWMRDLADILHVTGDAALGTAAAGSMVAAPLTTLGAITGGMVGGRAVDKLTQSLTKDEKNPQGKTWAEWALGKLGLQTPTLTEFFNPGMLLGGGAGARVPKGINYLARMGMPSYGYTPTTQYYFRPGYAGINGAPIGSGGADPASNEVLAIPLSSIFRNIRGTGSNVGLQEISDRLSNIVRRMPGFELTVENNVPVLRGTRGNLTLLQEDFNSGLKPGMGRLSIVPDAPQSGNTSVTRAQGPVIDVKSMNASAPMNRTRTAEEVALYGRYKIEDFMNPDGTPKIDLRLASSFDAVQTGAHGRFIYPNNSAEQVFSVLHSLYANPDIGRRELASIRRANPRGRSGILIDTHDGDLSTDSHELAIAIERSLGEQYLPIVEPGRRELVHANNFGSKNLFADKKLWQLSDELKADLELPGFRLSSKYTFEKEPNTGSIIIRDLAGSIRGYVPALSEDAVLEKGFNAPIRELNRKFGTNIRPATIIDKSSTPYPQWTFQKGILYPNLLGLILKKGGKFLYNNRIKLNKW